VQCLHRLFQLKR